MDKIIAWTGWSKEDWKEFCENLLGAVGLIGSFVLFFVYF